MQKIFSSIFICCIFCGFTNAFSQDNSEIKSLETTSTEQNSQNVFDNPIYKYTENSVEINLESIELDYNLFIRFQVKNLSSDKEIIIKTHNLDEYYITKFDIIENSFSITDDLGTNINVMAIIPKPDRHKNNFFNRTIAPNSATNVIIETHKYRVDKNASLLMLEIKPDVFGNENVCSFEVPIGDIQLTNKK